MQFVLRFPALQRGRLVALSIALTAFSTAGTVIAQDLKSTTNLAEAHRVLPLGKLPDDTRLGPLDNFDRYTPFSPPASLEVWQHRAERVRRQAQVGLGLWPMPTKSPLNAVVHGRIDRGDYTIEKVYFESFPGHFVSGNLYRPKGRTGKLPGVLCPHGHWPNGRFNETGLKEIREQIAEGAERFEDGGRFPQQARCVELARMGCVVFHYDMEGYADSQQIPIQVAHLYRKRRPEMDTRENWGLFSVQAELHLQNVMGIQTWNSIRALDFLLGLPDVDSNRIAVTGASGGGTQTFILAAIDPRVKVAVPAVMVSTAMQGGCTCESCCYLRIGTGNIELASLIAPRPLCCIAANDWTRDIMTKGYPELRAVYGLFRAPENVMAKALLQFPHNYNYVSRAVMYSWINRQFKLGLQDPVIEEDFKPLSIAEMTVWDAQHPRPPGGPEHERALLREMTADSAKQMAALEPKGDGGSAKNQAAEWRRIVGGAIDVMIGRQLPPAGAVKFDSTRTTDHDAYRETAGLIRYSAKHEELPALLLTPVGKRPRRIAIWIDADGKAGMYNADGQPKPMVKMLLDAGDAVLGVDLIYQGEFLPAGAKRLEKARRVNDPPNARDAACYTIGYNSPVFAQRVQDVLSAISAVAGALADEPVAPSGASKALPIDLIGFDGGAAWLAAAKAQAGNAVERVAVDTAGFRFADAKSIDDPDFWPGGAKYGDLPALLALDTSGDLWLAGEGPELPPLVKTIAKATGRLQNVKSENELGKKDYAAAVAWLTAARSDR
jgi:hypothetical protein